MDKILIPNSKNYFTIYKADENIRNCVIIMPGGGYRYTSPRESLPVAKAFNDKGFHAVVLNYREQIDTCLKPVLDACYTVDFIKKQKYINKVITLGFSAGGHLNGSLGCFYNEFKQYDARPDLMILSYPVITTDKRYIHQGSFNRLLEEEVSNEKWLKKMSLEKNIKKNMMPIFIWHTADDKSVNVFNSIRMFNALIKKQNDVTMHIYPKGVHGLSLATASTADNDLTKINEEVSGWFDMAVDWINFKLKNNN